MIKFKAVIEAIEEHKMIFNDNIEYYSKDDFIEIWLNNRRLQIQEKDIHKININFMYKFALDFPPSKNILMKKYPYKFVEPKIGDLVALKSINYYRNVFEIGYFIGFKESKFNPKIVAEVRGKTREYDFYQILEPNNDEYPFLDYWFNAKGNHVYKAVIDMIFKGTANDKK
jgi:hypothetical protein